MRSKARCRRLRRHAPAAPWSPRSSFVSCLFRESNTHPLWTRCLSAFCPTATAATCREQCAVFARKVRADPTPDSDLDRLRRGSVVLLRDCSHHDDGPGALVHVVKHAHVEAAENAAFVSEFVEVLDRIHRDDEAVSGIVLLGELPNLLR